MRKALRLLSVAALAALAPPSTSATAAELAGNSLELSWTDLREILTVGNGKQYSSTMHRHILLYVGTAGRVFSKSVSTIVKTGESRETDSVGNQATTDWQWHASGNEVIGFGRIGTSGVYRAQAAVKGGQCSLSVTIAKKIGENSINKINWHGVKINVLSFRVLDNNCSLRYGNVFSISQ